MCKAVIKDKAVWAVKSGHPWVFAGAVHSYSNQPEVGQIVQLVDREGTFLAWGLANYGSNLAIRLYSFTEAQTLTPVFWQYKVIQAIQKRRTLGLLDVKRACRIINSEGDGLSGLTVDYYAGVLSIVFTSHALYKHNQAIIQAIQEQSLATSGYLRTEKNILQSEGLAVEDQLLFGQSVDLTEVEENGLLLRVSPLTGQKSGLYLDQAANRMFAGGFAAGKKVLDLCCYTGGFSLNAAKAGALEVTGVDVSPQAVAWATQNAQRNKLKADFVVSDVFKYVDAALENKKEYDYIILDPPKFAHAGAGLSGARKGYLRLNTTAIKLLKPGGLLFTCSCTGRLDRNEFKELVWQSARTAGRQPVLLAERGANVDHPLVPSCPQSEYLKCLLLAVD